MANEKEGGSDKALAGGLAKARTAKADKPLFFAMVLKGSDGALLVERKKIAPAKIQEAKKRTGGSTVVLGVCYGEEGLLVFETAGAPGGTWAQAAKKIAKESCGATITAEFRQGRDPDSIPEPHDDEQETAEGSDEEAGDGAAAAQWARRSKAVAPRLLAALKANKGDVSKLRAVFTFAQEKAAAGDHAKALLGLDNLEKLLKAAESTTDDAAPPSADGKGNLAGWQTARETAVSQLKVVAAKVAATKDPDAVKVIVELQSIIKNLTPSPTTPQQVAELERYLADDVITAAEEVPPEYGTLHLRQPLLKALAKLKA